MRKRFLSKVLLAAAAILTLGACAADEFEGGNGGNTPARGQSLSIEVSGVGMEVSKGSTRSTYATSGGTVKETFEVGDEIGVYGLNGSEVIADNIKFTLNEEGHWEPASDVTYSIEYTYYAYYPWKANGTLTSQSCSFDTSAPVFEDGEGNDYDDSSDKFASFISNWPIAADQSSMDNFRASDFLAARGVNQAIPVVKFTMAHKMAMAELVPSYNYIYYAHDTSVRYPMAVKFSGVNQPFELDGTYYYIMRPGVNTTIGGQTLSASSGKFYYKRFETITGAYTLSYSTNGGSSWGSAPSWLSVTDYDNGTSNKALRIAFSASSTAATASNVGTSTVSNWDLSLHDVNGNATSMNTANCYMIHRPGTYKFPIVYGNAIKNSVTNTQAFSPTGSGDNFLSPFVNSSGTGITSPYLKDNGETPANAVVLWQDQEVVSTVSVSGDYVNFTVPNSAPFGNAVIAVRNSSNQILWSWHIWACPDWYSSKSMVPIKSGEYTYNVAPTNLGWVGSFNKKTYTGGECIIKMTPSGSGQEQYFTVSLPANTEEYIPTAYGYGPYYQWGRKDPEQPSVGNSNTAHAVTGTALTHSSTAVPIATTIRNPTVHYYNSANNGPYATNQYNLWDANEAFVTSSGNYAGHTVKTIYDPCPPGYCVPRGNLYYYITNGGTQTGYAEWSGTTYFRTWTRNFPRLAFPAAGCRYSGGGTSVGNVGSGGYCWSSSAYGDAGARYLYIYGTYFYWDYNYRAYGFSVRPVAEE